MSILCTVSDHIHVIRSPWGRNIGPWHSLRNWPPPFEALLEQLTADGRLVHIEHLPEQPEQHGALSRSLPEWLESDLDHRPLWRHQAEAIDLIRSGRNVVIATGTASGKSRCFQLPIAEAVADPGETGHCAAPLPHQGPRP